MNTNLKKYLGIAIVIVFLGSLGVSIFVNSTKNRTVATENSRAENLTENQKLKWSAVEQFQVRQTNESIQIDVPHLVDLCENNQIIHFQFSAYEISIAGNHPTLNYKISCNIALEKIQQHFEILFSDLLSLQQNKQIDISFGRLYSELIYSDENFPEKWSLTQISTEGLNAFVINQYEIQKVFGNNFEFELQSLH